MPPRYLGLEYTLFRPSAIEPTSFVLGSLMSAVGIPPEQEDIAVVSTRNLDHEVLAPQRLSEDLRLTFIYDALHDYVEQHRG